MDAFDTAAETLSDAVADAISEMVELMQAGIADGHSPMWMWRNEAYQIGREIGRAQIVGDDNGVLEMLGLS